jgi:hypothetical protein
MVPRAAFAALPVPASGQIGFRIMRNGGEIGSHRLGFDRQGDRLVVSIAIDIQVKMLGLAVFHYSHRATETWQGDQFIGIQSRTDKDGTPLQMRALRGPEGVVVEGSEAKRAIAPEGALPTTYWNRAMLGPVVINSEDGRLMRVTVTEGQVETVPLANGQGMPARHYSIGGQLQIQIWYDAQDQWAHLTFVKSDSTIIYQKL